ncbi:TPA: CRISPR-associated protein [Candidatus Sumerlaeota bacterium]|jgi:CRISPR-associated endonuclease/helicase Cas3|nr:CRISPR-associated protein [Candidatus Sumerlaeota bacterium]
MSQEHPIPEVWAHSPAQKGGCPDPYERHVTGVRNGALKRAETMLRHATGLPDHIAEAMLDSIGNAGTFHDLGKLDENIQPVFKKYGRGKLKWDHIDAGVAHLSAKQNQDWLAAWLVRAHHAPGLPQKAAHFGPDEDFARRLRGCRWDEKPHDVQRKQRERTDAYIAEYMELHEAVMGRHSIKPHNPEHGLKMRLALSCLVDADYTDSAFADSGCLPPELPAPRWDERLEKLCAYVQGLSQGESESERLRGKHRSEFFQACFNSELTEPMVACEGTVGLGKTTAVTAYLLQRAKADNLRRLIIVAPYTNILSQTAKRLRAALVLPGEDPNEVIVEHHHRADFSSKEDRDLAVLWRAPIVLTTAVSFFETLSANDPGTLRKLHALPGSAVFLDEAHAALPAALWPQNWEWLCELARDWGCYFVFASGSLTRFWEDRNIVEQPKFLPLLPESPVAGVLNEERRRVKYVCANNGNVLSLEALIEQVKDAPGPQLVILNTVQNAAVVARAMREKKMDVLHLSTALTPHDREEILKRVEDKLKDTNSSKWTLVATSCVEAGVDFSFRTAFRERFAVASIIQVGGRVNRHGEYNETGGSIVYDFALGANDLLTQHPGAKVSANILLDQMKDDTLNHLPPSDVVTVAMREEINRSAKNGKNPLRKAETERDYPMVKELGRVIDADTRLVVVEPELIKKLIDRVPVSFTDLLRGSVQIWAQKIDALKLPQLQGRPNIFICPQDWYDPEFIGYMKGVLEVKGFQRLGAIA